MTSKIPPCWCPSCGGELRIPELVLDKPCPTCGDPLVNVRIRSKDLDELLHRHDAS